MFIAKQSFIQVGSETFLKFLLASLFDYASPLFMHSTTKNNDLLNRCSAGCRTDVENYLWSIGALKMSVHAGLSCP
jgi:hypothetical protein